MPVVGDGGDVLPRTPRPPPRFRPDSPLDGATPHGGDRAPTGYGCKGENDGREDSPSADRLARGTVDDSAWAVARKIVRDYRRAMTGRQFIARVRRWARVRGVEVRFLASEGAGSHGTLHAGGRKTTVKDRRKEIGRGLLGKMLADLGIDPNDL